MNTSSGLQSDGFGRYVTLALVVVLLVSTVGGVIGGGVAAAQQVGNESETGNQTNGTSTNESGNQTNRTSNNFTVPNYSAAEQTKIANATIGRFENANFGYNQLNDSEQAKVRRHLRQLAGANISIDEPSSANAEVARFEGKPGYESPNRGIGNIPDEGDRAVVSDQGEPEEVITDLTRVHLLGLPEGEFDRESDYSKMVGIVEDEYAVNDATDEDDNRSPPGLDIPNLIAIKLDSLADSFKEGAASILTDLYNLAFSTPVPENSGWNGVLGTPVDTEANQTFHALYQTLLVGKLYPVTYSLLSVAIVFMAISMAGNPFMSHHEVVNYLIKLVLAIMYWAFAWVGVTLMHGAVNDITLWIRPSPEVMGELVTNVEALSAGAVGAYLVGSGGILTTLFTLGVELGMRRVLLVYVFPYLMPALLLVLYLSPWQRLRGYASMAIWQYVNVLTMTIPIAVLLKAAAVVSLEIQGKPDVVAMLILVALFGVAALFPVITTYFYIQMPGTAKKAAKRGASGAYSRLGAAKDKIGWSGDDSASDSSATSGSSPGENTDEAVAASLDSQPGSSGSESQSSTSTSTSTSTNQETSAESSGLPSSGTVDSTPDTTAGWVRELHDQENRDPMNDDAMIEAFTDDQPSRTTMNHKLAD
jgi:hypothetical protein